MDKEGAGEWATLFLSRSDEQGDRNLLVHYVTGKLFHRDMIHFFFWRFSK
jgi:hypothetical protein